MVLDFGLETFFNVCPIKPNGKINLWNAIKKLITGKHYLGEQYNLEKYVDITNIEVSKNDEYQEHQDCMHCKIIDHGIYFLPRIMESVYDVDKPKLKKLYESAKTNISDRWNEVPIHEVAG